MTASRASPTHEQQQNSISAMSKAAEMRRAGYSLKDIVDAGVYSRISAAQRALTTYYKKLHEQIAVDLEGAMTLDLERLDRAIQSVWTKVVDPEHPEHLKAVDRFNALIARRNKIMGTEAPQRVDADMRSSDGSMTPPGRVEIVAPKSDDNSSG